ncbi:MAG: CDP-diacylglycerol--glycerol-3-phosphate 3-phosphatidyltransferase [Mariprofundaceae bacterium]
MTWTISNRLTLLRVAMIPLFIAAFWLPGHIGWYLSALIFTLASFTDWMDGWLARQRDETTDFGRFLDPVADKLLVATALVLLVEADRIPGILAIIIIGREIAISALREWMAEKSAVVRVSLMGKLKTAAQMVAIVLLLVHVEIGGVSMHEIGFWLLWLAALLTLWSGYEYLRGAWRKLDETPAGAPVTEQD